MGKMCHRKTRAILMCHKFSQQNEPEKFYHAELMLFTAWRDEERDLLGNFETYSSSHESHKEEITTVKGRFYRQPEALTEAIDEFFEDGPPHCVWDELASHQRQENAECAEEGPEVERLVDCTDDSVLQTTFLDQTSAAAPASTATSERLPLMTDDEYYNLTRSLNCRQQEVFQFVLDWCRSKRQRDTTSPFYVYCTGGAGVGKSHLIHAIVQMVNRELRQPDDSPDDAIVILTAPTGTAAYAIRGQNLHSAFTISAKGIATLSAEKLDNLFITDFDAKNIKVNKSGLEALATMKNEQPLSLLHQPWLNNKGNSLRLAFLNTRSLQKHADDIMNSIYLDVCDVAVYAETRLQDDNVPNQLSQSRLFCANAPRQHNYVGGLAIIVSSDVVAEQVFCVTHELF